MFDTLPINCRMLIAQFAHPIHPCKMQIDKFGYMVSRFPTDDDEWSQFEFYEWDRWNDRLCRNRHEDDCIWLGLVEGDEHDTYKYISRHTLRLLAHCRVAECAPRIRDMIHNADLDRLIGTADMQAIDELVVILDAH